jgi:amidophosphoribosyltransferase
MASRDQLAAAKWTIEEIKNHIGATSLGYLSIPGAVRAVGRDEDHFCLACFNADYPIDVSHRLNPSDEKPVVKTGEMWG